MITKEYTDTELAKKVSKISVPNVIYGTNSNSEQSAIAYGTNYSANYIVQRDANGQINVPQTPTSNNHAASKYYVDNRVNTRVAKSNDSKKVYATSLMGGDTTIQYEETNALGQTIVMRNSSGQVVIATPTASNHATTKQYVDNLVASVKSGEFTKVDTDTYTTLNDFLATTGEEGIIYLYPIDINDTSKGYYQYIWENNEWIFLGTTNIDLNDYYTKTQVDSILGGYYTTNQVDTLLNGYVDLSNAQTITGTKTFKGDLKFVGASYTSEGVLTTDNSYAYLGFGGANTLFAFNGSRFLSNNVSGTDLGASNRLWKDLYLSGELKDGTNSMSIASLVGATNLTFTDVSITEVD